MTINPLASPSVGAPALKYGYVNIVTPSPGEVKGLIFYLFKYFIKYNTVKPLLIPPRVRER